MIGREQNDAKEGAIDKHQERKMLELLPKDDHSNRPSATFTNRNDIYGESSAENLDEGLVRDALERAKASKVAERGEKKRGYNSMDKIDVTVEDMEAYRITKISREDPMANILQSDELLLYDGSK